MAARYRKNNRNEMNVLVFCFRIAALGTIGPLLLVSIMVTYLNVSSAVLSNVFAEIEVRHLFLKIIKSENHYFYNEKTNKPLPSYSSIVFKMFTNINLKDSRTFLGREIPGLVNFDTKIAVAGQGTNISNLPIESAQPIEEILKGKKIKRNGEDIRDSNPIPPPLSTNENKVVYIYQTHSWESFLPLIEGATRPNDAVTANEQANIIAVGRKLSEALNDKGIGTRHDTTNIAEGLKQRNENYNHAYSFSRNLVQEAMTSDRNLKFLFDIHRDSLPRGKTTAVINGETFARIVFVIGKEHKNYEQNLQFAKELNSLLEQKYPGLSRGVFIKGKSTGNGVYNQDFSNRAVLLEFGGVENNFTELNNAIKAFVDIFSDYYWKAEKVNG